jgi:CRISPR-associated protein Csm2
MPRPTGYFGNDGKTPRPELFDAEAQEEAKRWAKIKSAQLRRFFGQVMADRRQFEIKGAQARDEEAKVAMALLKAGAAYAAARDADRKPLADFAAHHAGLVRTIAHFRAFARHFEAVVAWHKVFEKDREDAARQERHGQGAAAPRPGGGYQGRR